MKINEETKCNTIDNEANTTKTTLSRCLDLFGLGESMRSASIEDRQDLFMKAYNEDPETAMKLLFYIRDIRGGYGEKSTFIDMLKWVADNHPESVEKNLWGILEYGKAKDLYCLIGTKCEQAMWSFIKNQFETDVKNMKSGKSISLLAKWLATPDASSKTTAALGKKTAKAIGYDYRNMKSYKILLRRLRRYLDIPEAKMCLGQWNQIEYSKIGSQCLIKYHNAFIKHDTDRYNEFLNKAINGERNIPPRAMGPCEIIREVENNYRSNLDILWMNLEDYCTDNALVVCDTSNSMCGTIGKFKLAPIHVGIALSIYFAERNKGKLKDLFITFSDAPMITEIHGDNLQQKYYNIYNCGNDGLNTNLEAIFDKLLNLCIEHKVPSEDLPKAILIITDMKIDSSCSGVYTTGSAKRIAFYDKIKSKYEDYGYILPQIIFWNVNSVNPAFHACGTADGISLVSGYSPSIFKTVMENIGTNPYELMMKVISSDRYSNIIA